MTTILNNPNYVCAILLSGCAIITVFTLLGLYIFNKLANIELDKEARRQHKIFNANLKFIDDTLGNQCGMLRPIPSDYLIDEDWLRGKK